MAMVLTNLLDNAVKFSPDGSEIIVEAEATDDTVRSAVSDAGPGIPPDARERVFERFYRLDGRDNRQVYGYGLGCTWPVSWSKRKRGRYGLKSTHRKALESWSRCPECRRR